LLSNVLHPLASRQRVREMGDMIPTWVTVGPMLK